MPATLAFSRTGFTGCGKSSLFCHSERSEESLFDLTPGREREIPRSARNDKRSGALFPQPVKGVRHSRAPVFFCRPAERFLPGSKLGHPGRLVLDVFQGRVLGCISCPRIRLTPTKAPH